MLDTVKINHVQHISFTQSRLTDAVSVILSELLSYEHPSKAAFRLFSARRFLLISCLLLFRGITWMPLLLQPSRPRMPSLPAAISHRSDLPHKR